MLVDFNLNHYNGVELLKISKVLNSHIQSVLVIQKADEEAEVEGLKSVIDLIMEYEKAASVNRAYIERLITQRKQVLSTYINNNGLTVNGVLVVLTRKEMKIVSILIEKG